jgi:hypothetical protein
MSSYAIPRFTRSLLAAVDLSAKQFYYVADNGSGKYNVSGSAYGTIGGGFLMNKPLADEFCEVASTGGGAKAVAAATIATALTELKADADGKVIPALAGDIVIAIAMETAAVDDTFEVLPVYYRKSSPGLSILAGVDLTSATGLYVGDNGSGKADGVGGATGAIGYGFLANAPDTDEAAVIHGVGYATAEAISGAAIAGGGLELLSDANSKLQVATTAGDIVVAISTASAAGADEAITVIPVMYRKHV